jgi:anthranilate phosphoribosyltransferase
MRAYLDRLLAGDDLTVEEARSAMSLIMRGEASPAQIAAFLTALRAKGETADEIAGAAAAMREHVAVELPASPDLVDIVGTGGDNSGTFNISTTAAIVASSAGVRVAKHGNRAFSSTTGSADVLEALGVRIDLPHAHVARMVDEIGFGFLFAPSHHPAMRFAAPVRRELGFRTVMNLTGPLVNPAGAQMQVLGVPRQELVGLFARVVRRLGTRRTLVVCGVGDVDELTPVGPFRLATVEQHDYRTDRIDPIDLGLERCRIEDLAGGDARMNATIVRRILEGERGPKRDTVLLNAAAGLIAGYAAGDFLEGLALAAEAVDTGRAAAQLERIIELSNDVGDEEQ